MKLDNYHKNLKTLHVNTESERPYYEIYSDIENARRSNEDRKTMLNGDWDFAYYGCAYDVPEDFINGSTDGFKKIPVPSCWQNHGYDTHQYTNVRYPFPYNPPYVPYETPCGAYVTEFSCEKRDGERLYLNFEGVDSCLYLWINGSFVGYSQVSHSTSEFDVTDFVKDGANILAALVMKWCDGSYLEDQDKLRMSGIFRDVYILRRPETHVTDYTVTTAVDGTVTVKTDTAASFVLEDADGKVVYSGTDGTIKIDKPVLWNAENPYLYTLYIATENEVIKDKVGIREIKIEDGIFLLNGKPIKMRGVNRHDSDPVTGYTISREQAEKDLMMMKRHNINAIRTSHYPNAPWFTQMCDEYGFYVIAEADLEIHGTSTLYGGSQESTFGLLANDLDWGEAILDRNKRSVIRDKNRPCVCLWSAGNEGGYGTNIENALHWIKSYDPTRPTHYESASCQTCGHKNDLTDLDVISTMYASYEWIDEYFKNPGVHVLHFGDGDSSFYDMEHAWTDLPEKDEKQIKPYMQCEFVHAMGNGPGGIKEYIDRMYRYDGFFGAFVWEWCDHAVYKDGKYLYGGDFGEFPHDGNFCMDGLVYPDRRPHVGLLEYKQAVKPFKITSYGKILIVENRYDFSELDDMLDFEINGETVKFDVPPRGKKSFPMPDGDTLMIKAYQKNNTPWADKGYEVGFEQIIVNDTVKALENVTAVGSVSANETERYITVSGEGFEYEFDKAVGNFTKLGGAVTSAVEWNVWRAPTDNDRNIRNIWQSAGYDRECTYVYDISCETADGAALIKCHSALIPVFLQKTVDIFAEWTIYANGVIDLKADVKVNKDLPPLPRFGLRFFTEGENVRYYGCGPYESYSDKHLASYLGEFETTVGDMHEDYVKPQENGSHFGTRYFETDTLRVSSDTPFSFSASHYTQEELTEKAHNFELEPCGETVLCVDYKQDGIGQNACGPLPLEEYRFDEKEFTWKIRIEVKNPV